MKKKNYLTTTMFLLMALVMAAQPVNNMIGNNPQSKQETIIQIGKNIYRNNQLITPQQQSKNVLSEPTDSATVHVRFLKRAKQDVNRFQLVFYNNTFSIGNYVYDTEEKEVRIPVGIYDIYSHNFSLNGQQQDLLRHIKELVSITSDTTIVIDFSECVNKWTDEIQMANGELMTRTIIRQLDHEPWQETVVEGNMLFEYGDLMIRNYEFDFIGHNLTSHPDLLSNADGSTIPSGGYFNNISDRYTFIQNMCYACNDGNFYTSYAIGNGYDCMPLRVTKDDYVLCEEKIGNTPLSEEVDSWPNGSKWWVTGATSDKTVAQIQMWPYERNDLITFTSMGTLCYLPVDETGTIRTYIQPTDAINPIRIKVLDYIDTASGTNEHISNETPKFQVMKNGESLYLVDGLLAFVHTEKSEPFEYEPDYPPHPKFSFTASQRTDIFFNNCPINAMISSGRFNKNINAKLLNISTAPCGRYGELINSDIYYSTLSVKYNDEVIYDGALSTWWPENREDGTYELSIINANVLVDDINGKNVATVYFDQTKKDWNSPVLKMLQFRDNENKVTDRFDSPENGTIMFAGGDFEPTITTYIDNDGYERDWWFEACQPMIVEVSYSPYGTDDWQPLEGIEHQSEFDDIPGMGFFYSGSLASVNVPSENKWYDLKFRLVDESGNWQEQIVSPAFKIESLVPEAITEVSNGNATEVARYSIDGRRITSPEQGINIVEMSDGTTRKVLIK